MTSTTCNRCSHLIGVRYKLDTVEKWNCGHSNIKYEVQINLVTGEETKIYSYPITHVRYNLCNGNWFEEYIPPAREPTIGGSIAMEFDETALAANRKAAADRVTEIKARRNAKLTGDDLKNL